MDLRDAIKERILILCAERNVTVNKLCMMSGITQSTVNNIINSGCKNPTVSTVKKLCDGLDITLSEFFDSPIFNLLDQEVK